MKIGWVYRLYIYFRMECWWKRANEIDNTQIRTLIPNILGTHTHTQLDAAIFLFTFIFIYIKHALIWSSENWFHTFHIVVWFGYDRFYMSGLCNLRTQYRKENLVPWFVVKMFWVEKKTQQPFFDVWIWSWKNHYFHLQMNVVLWEVTMNENKMRQC